MLHRKLLYFIAESGNSNTSIFFVVFVLLKLQSPEEIKLNERVVEYLRL